MLSGTKGRAFSMRVLVAAALAVAFCTPSFGKTYTDSVNAPLHPHWAAKLGIESAATLSSSDFSASQNLFEFARQLYSTIGLGSETGALFTTYKETFPSSFGFASQETDRGAYLKALQAAAAKPDTPEGPEIAKGAETVLVLPAAMPLVFPLLLLVAAAIGLSHRVLRKRKRSSRRYAFSRPKANRRRVRRFIHSRSWLGTSST